MKLLLTYLNLLIPAFFNNGWYELIPVPVHHQNMRWQLV